MLFLLFCGANPYKHWARSTTLGRFKCCLSVVKCCITNVRRKGGKMITKELINELHKQTFENFMRKMKSFEKRKKVKFTEKEITQLLVPVSHVLDEYRDELLKAVK